MSEEKDTGGAAFPLKEPLTSDNAGMELRDYFAGQALGEVIAGLNMAREIGKGQLPELAAKYVYRIADALLKERNEK